MIENKLCAYMASSAEIWIVNKIAEIAERCGASPINAEICFSIIEPSNGESPYYAMGAVDNLMTGTEQDAEKVQRVWALLGLDQLGYRRFDSLWEAEEAINQALAIAPRARIR